MRSERSHVLTAVLLGALACGAVRAATAQERGHAALEEAPGRDRVAAHCGACHSLALVTQNRGDAAHWTKLIRWMQAEHNLWDLGPAEDEIVAYLAQHYGEPGLPPRRAPLDTTWRSPEP